MVREARIGIGDTNCPSDIVQNVRHQAQLPFITSMKQQTRTRKPWHQSVGVGTRVLCTILSNSREPWSTSERHHHLGSAVQFSFRPRRCNGNSFIAIAILLSRSRMQEKSLCAESKRFASFGRPDKTTKTKTADELHTSSSRPRMLQLSPATLNSLQPNLLKKSLFSYLSPGVDTSSVRYPLSPFRPNNNLWLSP